MASLMRIDGGTRASVQDAGRSGVARFGVSASGTADRAALLIGNRLVGATDDSAQLEVPLSGGSFSVGRDAWVAVTGAPCAISAGHREVFPWRAVAVRKGDEISIGPTTSGTYSYLCVDGGIQTPVELGARSTDTGSGFGFSDSFPSEGLPIGSATEPCPETPAGHALHRFAVTGGCTAVRIVAAPNIGSAARRLDRTEFVIHTQSDRRGQRLDGPALESIGGEVDEPVPVGRGTIQVPPSGQPIVLGPDASVTGGYLVVATVIDADLDRLLQRRPGDRVLLRVVSIDEARRAARRRRDTLKYLLPTTKR